MSGGNLTICDLSPLYCDNGGGIRTYHRARIDWFRRQHRHRYVLICPGPRFDVSEVAPNVRVARVYGPAVRRDQEGYRAMLDVRAATRVIEECRPDVIEMSDALLGGLLRVFLRRVARFDGVISSFCHSDPLAAYVQPSLIRFGCPTALREWTMRRAERLYGGSQAQYDVTMVASRTLERRLHDYGITNVVVAPFGVDPGLFEIRRRRAFEKRHVGLLFVGRLDRDKDVELLIDVLPRLLNRGDVTITVAGAGKFQPAFERLRHPRFSYEGFVGSRDTLARLYQSSDILLAPGRFETFGLAALEAAAAGLAIVGPDCGGTGELLAQLPAPCVFPAGNAAAFFEAIVSALDSDLERMSADSRVLARRYGTWHDAVGRQIAVYESIVGDRQWAAS